MRRLANNQSYVEISFASRMFLACVLAAAYVMLFSEEGGSIHPPNAVCNSLATAIDRRSWKGAATTCAE